MVSKTVIITGASRGLGAATARILARMQCRVVLQARSEDPLQKLVTDIKQAGGEALAVPGDVRNPNDCQRLAEIAHQHFGSIDVLINNAGVIEPIETIANAHPEAWSDHWQTNVLGPVNITQAALTYLRTSKGRVVNISSKVAIRPTVGSAAYCMSKAAINMFTAILALEEPDITAIAFRPGVIDTGMQTVIRDQGKDVMNAERYAYFVQRHEEGTIPPPEVPGRMVAVLALYTPHDWSGQFVGYDEENVLALVNDHYPSNDQA